MGPIPGATCDICGEGLPGISGLDAPSLCGACQETRPFFTRAVAFGAYDAELRELIHLLKYEQVLPAAAVLGRMLAEAISKLNLGNAPLLLVPVPLHKAKRRQRGFNQAELIGRAALKASSHVPQSRRGKADALAVLNVQLAPEVLVRVRPTASQIGLTRPQRIENMRGAFQVAHLSRVEKRRILLIDDVLTTGTTVSECARVLRKAGAENVWVATVARTLKQGHQELALEPEAEFAAT
jgi:ComF family protein